MDYLWLPMHSTDDDKQCVQIGHVLYALRESLAQLDTWYNTIPHLPKLSPAQFSPYPCQFKKDGTLFKFEYQSPLAVDMSCQAYLATLKNDSTQVVVKFVTVYGEEAHKVMADAGFAPKLLYYGPIQPGDLDNPLKMVIMEYVSVQDHAYMQGTKELEQQLPEIIDTLHAKGFMFGDLRLLNIVITDEGKVQLIDFDWAGKENEV